MAEIRIHISADQAQDAENVESLVRAHYTDPQAVRRVEDDGSVLLVVDSERKAPPRVFVAESWTDAKGAVYTVARDKTSEPLTAEQKAKIENIDLADRA